MTRLALWICNCCGVTATDDAARDEKWAEVHVSIIGAVAAAYVQRTICTACLDQLRRDYPMLRDDHETKLDEVATFFARKVDR